MASETQNSGLSFLRKQEPRLLDGPGFRIKCGITDRRAADGEIDAEFYYFYAKQSQFPKKSSERKAISNNEL
jgi:hypothetical protein